ERPLAQRVEVALDHRLDVDAGPAGGDEDAGDPAAGVRHAGARAPAGAPLSAQAAFRRGIESQSGFLKEGAAGQKLTPALRGAKPREPLAVHGSQAQARARQRARAEVGDARRGYPGLPGHRRNTRLALVPPNPRLLLITAPRVALRAVSMI